PFLGVQTLTQTCPSSAPSGGPFQASTWASLAPGEVRVESAAAQIIATSVPSDGPVGRAFDPIAGDDPCATASATDQTGAASYRSAAIPAGGFTLMGSATVVADILNVGPTSQIAARLLDVDTGGNETLIARGLYRPEVQQLITTCQV